MPTSTVRFYLPFPIHGILENELESKQTVPFTNTRTGDVVNVPTTVRVTIMHHDRARIMELYGLTRHGEGTSYYDLDTKGLFAYSQVVMEFEDWEIRMPFDDVGRRSLLFGVIYIINDLLEALSATTGTFWTPSVTPQDLIGLVIGTKNPIQRETGMMMTLDCGGYLHSLVQKPLAEVAPTMFNVVCSKAARQWVRTFRDALREFWHLKPVRAAGLSAISLEVFLAYVTRNAPVPDDHKDKTKGLSLYGDVLLKVLVGHGLCSKKRFKDVASMWRMAVQGRNHILHMEEARFVWKDFDNTAQTVDVTSPEGAAYFILAVAKIIDKVMQELQQVPEESRHLLHGVDL